MKRAHTKVVPVDECLLEDQRADAIIRDIRSLLKSFKIMIYNEDSGYGLLRHVMVRTALLPARSWSSSSAYHQSSRQKTTS